MNDRNTNYARIPNLLIAGAGKSGTTSLYNYLRQHPDIAVGSRKEGRFFSEIPIVNDDQQKPAGKKRALKYEEYLKLFEGIGDQKIVLDASPDYLYHYEKSIKNILKYADSDLKIIIILRNPVDKAYSQYCHLVRDGKENLTFQEALKAEGSRKRYELEWIWYYTDTSYYYNSVKAFLETFNKKVKIYLYEDLVDNEQMVLREIFKFINIDAVFLPETSRKYNVSGIPVSSIVNSILNSSYRAGYKDTVNRYITPLFLNTIGHERTNMLLDYIKRFNMRKIEMTSEERNYLRDLFREDIIKTQDLIGRDLSHWLE